MWRLPAGTRDVPSRSFGWFLTVGSGLLAFGGYWLLNVSAQSMTAPTITKVVAGGDPTPIGGVFASDGIPAFGLGDHSLASGTTVFYAIMIGTSPAPVAASQPVTPNVPPPPLPFGIFRVAGGKTSKVLATGDPAPGGGKFIALFPPATNVSGDVAVGAIVQREDNSLEEGVFLAAQESLTAIGAALKLGGNSEASVLSPTLSDSGEVITKMPLPGDTSKVEIVRSTKTSASKVVGADTRSATGQQLSLAAADPSPPALAGNGDVIFRSDEGIFRASRSGLLSKVVGYGDATTNGKTVKAFDVPRTNTSGDVVFTATLDLDPNTNQPLQSIMIVSQGKLTPLASSSQATPLGDAFVYVGSPVVNDRGDVAFGATTNGPPRVKGLFPITAGIFMVSRGQLIKVAASGDPTPIGGVFLSSFGSPAIDNAGTVRFHATIDLDGDGNPDNQGIFAAKVGGT